MRHLHAFFVSVAMSCVLGASVLAHVDLAGGWGQRFHEDRFVEAVYQSIKGAAR